MSHCFFVLILRLRTTISDYPNSRTNSTISSCSSSSLSVSLSSSSLFCWNLLNAASALNSLALFDFATLDYHQPSPIKSHGQTQRRTLEVAFPLSSCLRLSSSSPSFVPSPLNLRFRPPVFRLRTRRFVRCQEPPQMVSGTSFSATGRVRGIVEVKL